MLEKRQSTIETLGGSITEADGTPFDLTGYTMGIKILQGSTEYLLSATITDAGAGEYEFLLDVPTLALAPGRYVLEIHIENTSLPFADSIIYDDLIIQKSAFA